MPHSIANPWRGKGLLPDAPLPIADPSGVAAILEHCPAHGETPLTSADILARQTGVAEVWIKDERGRMGLGSFKALGASHAIARDAAEARCDDWSRALGGRTYVTASAGNHGLSVAAGARVFGACSVIYIAETVPDAFETRLTGYGAKVMRECATYEESMEAAENAATTNGWTLLSDSTWPGYTEPGRRVMEGYVQMGLEAARQIPAPPTHILLQAGVGGLAAAMAAHARHVWGDGPQILVVEPEDAPALVESIRAGALVATKGPVSCMGRLDCKTPSLVALAGLSRDADRFVTISEAEAKQAMPVLAAAGFATTPSGGAGLAALLAGLDLGPDARVLTILSEGPEDG